MKNYLIIMRFIDSNIILKKVNSENDSKAIKLTALTIVENFWTDEYNVTEEQKEQDIKWAETEPLDMIQDLCSSTDLTEVILYDINNDKIIIQK